jgi:biotin carboxyl carrier protein
MKMIRITLEGRTYEVGIEVVGSAASARLPATQSAPARIVAPPPPPVAPVPPPVQATAAAGGGHAILSPMPGVVFKLRVAVGQQVAKDEELIVLEAMKMESPLHAPSAGTVAAIMVKEGDSVNEGQVLIQLN